MLTRIHLGAGEELKPGWLNIGLEDRGNVSGYLNWDLSKGLPGHLNNIDEIYSCHFFEHLSTRDGLKLMLECYSVLKLEGKFRLALPDFKDMIKNYLSYCDAGIDRHWDILPWDIFSKKETRTPIDVCEFGVYQGGEHKSIWDISKAIKCLEYTGFRKVTQVEYSFDYEPASEMRRRYTFVVEGIK
jgi:hypothetical protein